MSDEIMLVFGEDGVAREYDDTWDITIHCESEEEQKVVLEKLNNSNREPQELSKNSPKLDKKNGDLQPTCNQLATDCISRQAAIEVADAVWCVTGDVNVAKVWDQLKNLPSAQPESEKRKAESAQNVPIEDLISRKAAIEAMGKAQWAKERLMELPSAQPEPCEDAVSREAAIDVAENAFVRGLLASPDIRKLPSAQPEPQWISVTERLPKSKPEDLEYPTVIACCEDGEVMTACYYENTKEWGIGENYDRKINPVAWMPLPEPYRAERRTDDTAKRRH